MTTTIGSVMECIHQNHPEYQKHLVFFQKAESKFIDILKDTEVAFLQHVVNNKHAQVSFCLAGACLHMIDDLMSARMTDKDISQSLSRWLTFYRKYHDNNARVFASALCDEVQGLIDRVNYLFIAHPVIAGSTLPTDNASKLKQDIISVVASALKIFCHAFWDLMDLTPSLPKVTIDDVSIKENMLNTTLNLIAEVILCLSLTNNKIQLPGFYINGAEIITPNAAIPYWTRLKVHLQIPHFY